MAAARVALPESSIVTELSRFARWADTTNDDASPEHAADQRTYSFRNRLRTDSDLGMPTIPPVMLPVLPPARAPVLPPVMPPVLPLAMPPVMAPLMSPTMALGTWPAMPSAVSPAMWPEMPPYMHLAMQQALPNVVQFQAMQQALGLHVLKAGSPQGNVHGYVGPACSQQAPTVSPALEAQQTSLACGAGDTGMQEELQTTVCFRNLPNNYTNEMVRELLDTSYLKDRYDFFYVPHDITRLPSLVNVGYFYVDFESHDVALRAWGYLCGFKDWAVDSHKVLSATWATKTFVRSFVKAQGQTTCPVMRQNIPAECKPMFVKSGVAKHGSEQTVANDYCVTNGTNAEATQAREVPAKESAGVDERRLSRSTSNSTTVPSDDSDGAIDSAEFVQAPFSPTVKFTSAISAQQRVPLNAATRRRNLNRQTNCTTSTWRVRPQSSVSFTDQ